MIFSAIALMIALFFLLSFASQTGWANRDLPDNFGLYIAQQLGLAEVEGRLSRFGKLLKQSWVAPAICMSILIPAAIFNLRSSVKTHNWRKRFKQPVDARFELAQWARALEFVVWFIVYTLIVPVLGYLVSTLVFGTLLPWRMGYRGGRWFLVCLVVSLAIVLVFRTGLQIRTPVNIWLYNLMPEGPRAFMQTWF